MKDNVKELSNLPFPGMIKGLPEIDVPMKGVRGWLLQGSNKQVVFFDIEQSGKVPPHSHCAQWGIVVAGEMKLTIGGETRVYKRGDWYYIPAGTVHSATFLSRVHAIDVFDDPERYKTRRIK